MQGVNIVELVKTITNECKSNLGELAVNLDENTVKFKVGDGDITEILQTLLLQQKELGFEIHEIFINAKELIGSVIISLENKLLEYTWDNTLGLWD